MCLLAFFLRVCVCAVILSLLLLLLQCHSMILHRHDKKKSVCTRKITINARDLYVDDVVGCLTVKLKRLGKKK